MNKNNVPQEGAVSKANARLVPLKEAGRLLSVSERTVRRLSQSGTLPPIVKVGGAARINLQGVMVYIARLLEGGRV